MHRCLGSMLAVAPSKGRKKRSISITRVAASSDERILVLPQRKTPISSLGRFLSRGGWISSFLARMILKLPESSCPQGS